MAGDSTQQAGNAAAGNAAPSQGDAADSNKSDRHLNVALEKVSESWFPVNPQLLKTIRNGINKGLYDFGIDFLLNEIRTDFALFTYCVRALVEQVRKENGTIPDCNSPFELVRALGIERLKQVLLVDASEISTHMESEFLDVQGQQIQEAMVTASTAEVLSQKHFVDPELAYSTGLLRHLGLTLIAWNYPQVYREKLSSLKPGESIDDALSTALGFSPSLLGSSLVQRWGLSPQICAAINTNSKEAEEDLSEVETTLVQLCEVGEALARANSPEHYPTAKADWEYAKKEIEGTLGTSGLNLIRETVKKNCEAYITMAPQVFSRAAQLEPELHLKNMPAQVQTNKFVPGCPSPLREQLESIYAQRKPGEIAKECIPMLTKVIIPGAGFNAGCVYILQPESMTLVPRLALGVSKLTDFEKIQCSATASNPSLITAAFGSNAPLNESDSLGRCKIAGVIGTSQRAGVLVLDYEEQRVSSPNNIFQAICATLGDCLNLK